MLNYSLPGGLPAGGRALWSQFTLQPLAKGVLTPFSYSTLAEMASRAWYRYYDRLGFNPMPKARVVRQYHGRAYFNLTLSAQREAEAAGVEPLKLMVDGKPFPACRVEKGGLLAGLRAGMNQRKIERALRTMADESDAVVAKAQKWWLRVRELRWTQAEILQVMEEIEPVGAESFSAFLAARQNIDYAYNRLLWSLSPGETGKASLLLHQALCDLQGVGEYELNRQLASLPKPTPPAVAWMQTGETDRWREALPDATLVDALTGFLGRYGHYSANLGEISQPRWEEDPAPLLCVVAAGRGQDSARQPTAGRQGSEAAVNKQVQESLQQIRSLLPLQSHALEALAYLLAGTRQWAMAAAREAMGDKRILERDNVFFFELEEMKQMMTGEWNISDLSEIQATAEKRKAQYAQWMATSAPDILIGDAPANSLDPVGLPAALDPLAGVVSQQS